MYMLVGISFNAKAVTDGIGKYKKKHQGREGGCSKGQFAGDAIHETTRNIINTPPFRAQRPPLLVVPFP